MLKKIDWHEINRKIFHILGGLILAAGIYFDIIKLWMIITTVLFGIILSIIYTKYNIPIIDYFLNTFEREHLKKKFPGKGVIYLFLAVIFMMLLFEKNIVIAGIMIWAFGDSMSAIVGKHYGNIKHPLNTTRVLEGTLAGIIAASITASFFVYWPYAIIGATIAMIIESLEWELYTKIFDDNLFVPLIGSTVIYLLTIIF